MPSFRTSDSVKIHFEVLGAPSIRPPLLLIHGFPLTSRLWSLVAPALMAHGQVILVDLRGFGKSAVPAGPYTMERYAKDMAELLQSLDIKHVLAVGHSMGGYIALAMAELFPALVTGLGLVNSHPFADDEKAREGRYATAERVLKGDRIGWNHEMLPKMLAEDASDEATGTVEAMIEQQESRAIAAALVGMALRPHRQHVWRQFAGASFLIAGKNDMLLPLAKAEQTRAMRPSALFRILDTGHCGMVEQPGQFAAALLDWWMPYHHGE